MKQRYANDISHRRFCRTDKNYISAVQWGGGGASFGTPRLTALRVFLEKLFSLEHNNNLKWAILGT
jgi:hypothetical protein